MRARGLAEAEAIAARAEALARESEAVINQQIAEKLPDIVRAGAEAFRNVDTMTVLNGAQGVTEMVTQVIAQAGPAMEIARNAFKGNGRSPNGAPSEERTTSSS